MKLTLNIFLTTAKALGMDLQGCFCSTRIIKDYLDLEVAAGVCCARVSSFPGLVDCKVPSDKVHQFALCCKEFHKAYAFCRKAYTLQEPQIVEVDDVP